MFGYNVTDEETIPSAFVREYQRRNTGTSIKVVNYGVPLYYSYHELILLADKLFTGNKPDIVIMLDGLNDCGSPYAALSRNPFNTPRMQQTLNPELYKYPENFTYANWPDSTKIPEASNQIVANYLENISNARKLANEFNFKLYCFWQPVPYFNYDRSKDPFCARNVKEQFATIYPQIEQKSKEIDYLYYLGNMLQQEKYCFIDSVHYSPRISDLIAKTMVDSVFK